MFLDPFDSVLLAQTDEQSFACSMVSYLESRLSLTLSSTVNDMPTAALFGKAMLARGSIVVALEVPFNMTPSTRIDDLAALPLVAALSDLIASDAFVFSFTSQSLPTATPYVLHVDPVCN